MLRPLFELVPREYKPSDDHNSLILAERERIANLLHDRLAQDLAFVNSQAAAIRKLLSKGDTARAMEQTELLEEVSQNLSGDIRSLIRDLNQPEMVAEGLEVALQELTENFSRLYQIPIFYEVCWQYDKAQISPHTTLEIYYIIQETLVNIRKHAAANTVWVQLVGGKACVDVIVRDDGRGFRTRNVDGRSRQHFGLSVMHARARRIGAQLKIERLAEYGTQITLCIPHIFERQK